MWEIAEYILHKNGDFQKLTTDHSYVEDLIQDGTITEAESHSHPKKHMLTKALGCEDVIEPDIISIDLNSDDVILMCSDGLTNGVQEYEIYDSIIHGVENACEWLVSSANKERWV